MSDSDEFLFRCDQVVPGGVEAFEKKSGRSWSQLSGNWRSITTWSYHGKFAYYDSVPFVVVSVTIGDGLVEILAPGSNQSVFPDGEGEFNQKGISSQQW